MVAVTPAVRRHHVRETSSVTDVVDVDPVSDARAVRLRGQPVMPGETAS